jgi:hypothetical protein
MRETPCQPRRPTAPIRGAMRNLGVLDRDFEYALWLYNALFDPREVVDLLDSGSPPATRNQRAWHATRVQPFATRLAAPARPTTVERTRRAKGTKSVSRRVTLTIANQSPARSAAEAILKVTRAPSAGRPDEQTASTPETVWFSVAITYPHPSIAAGQRAGRVGATPLPGRTSPPIPHRRRCRPRLRRSAACESVALYTPTRYMRGAPAGVSAGQGSSGHWVAGEGFEPS